MISSASNSRGAEGRRPSSAHIRTDSLCSVPDFQKGLKHSTSRQPAPFTAVASAFPSSPPTAAQSAAVRTARTDARLRRKNHVLVRLGPSPVSDQNPLLLRIVSVENITAVGGSSRHWWNHERHTR